jgi:membrane protein
MSTALPGGAGLWQVINIVISLGVTAGLFAMLYKIVPDLKLAWRDVVVGAVATALLFSLGKFAIGMYLGKSAATSVFGAAGSLAVLFIWVYYSAQIVLFGAEFTQVWANAYGSQRDVAQQAARDAAAESGRTKMASRDTPRRDRRPGSSGMPGVPSTRTG